MPVQIDTELHSNFDIAGEYPEDAPVVAPKPQNNATMKGVILAGSFGARLVADISALHYSGVGSGRLGATGSGGDARTMGAYVKELRGAVGDERIPEVLLDLDDIDVLEYWTLVLRQVERLWPLEENLYVVCNEKDHTEFLEWADPEVSGTQFNQANIVSNGCLSKADWKGDAADLKLAIEHFGITCDVVAIGSASICYPDFNFSRVVEHSVIRNKDVLCVQAVGVSHLALNGDEVQTVVVPKDDHDVPMVVGFEERAAQAGDLIAQNMAVIKASSIPEVLASSAPSLTALLQEFAAARPIAAIKCGWGYFRLDTLRWLNYAHSFFIQFGIMKKSMAMKDKTQDTNSSIKFGTEDRTITRMAEDVRAQMNSTIIQQFDEDYFGSGATNYQARMSYKIPSTFYQTNYRRMIEYAGK